VRGRNRNAVDHPTIAALYTRVFDLDGQDLSLLSMIFSPFNLYYDGTLAENAYLGRTAHTLTGRGMLAAYNPGACNSGGETPDVREPNALPTMLGALAGLLPPGWTRRKHARA